MDYGYARVSTKEQNEQRQAEGIAAAKARGRTVWAKAERKTTGISGGSGNMAQTGTVCKGSRCKARRHTQDVSKMGRTGHTPLKKVQVTSHG